MWNSLLKTITGAAGQAAQKVQQYIAPKPTPAPKVISQQQMMSNYTFSQPKPVNIQSAINTGGLKVNSAPPTSPFQPTSSGGSSGGSGSSSGGGGSSWSAPKTYNSVASTFKNPFTISKAYASDGSAPTPSSNTNSLDTFKKSVLGVLGSAALKINPVAAWTNQQLINSGKAHAGSWGGMADIGATEKAGNYFSGLIKGYGARNDVLGTTTSSDGSLELSKRMAEEAARQKANNSGTYNNGAKTNGSDYDKLSAIDAETTRKLDELQSQVVDGTIGQEEAAQRAKEIQDQANNLLYDQLIASQEGEIPLLNQEFDTAKTSLENSTAQAAADAKAVKASNINTVGETLRKLVGNKEIAQKNINNVYTAAGSAGGSDYLSAISGLERDTGNNIATGERDLQERNAAIDRQQLTFENGVKTKVNELVLEKQRQLKAINDNVNMSRMQKQAASMELNAKLATDLAEIRSFRDNAMNSFTQMKQQLALNTGELAKNGIINPSPYAGSSYTPLDAGTDPSKQSGSDRATKPIKQYGVNPKTGKYGPYLLDPRTGLKTFA